MANHLLASTALCLSAASCVPQSIDGARTAAANEVFARMDPSGALVDDAADSYGVTSKGYRQVRGNGCLGLSADGLLFVPWTADQDELWIPIDHVLSADTTDAHLGKGKGRLLLRVRFVDEAGSEDSVAWAVKDPPRWVSTLHDARARPL
jgi:hypothetical protein